MVRTTWQLPICTLLLAALGTAIVPYPCFGAIVVDWDAGPAVSVSVPVGGSVTYNAYGTIQLGTLDALLVYDVSGSMAFQTGQTAPNGGTQRGDWAEAGAMAFVDSLPGIARLGITKFKGDTSLVVPIDLLGPTGSPHRNALNQAIDGMPRNGTDGTNIANAIAFAAAILNDPSVNSDSKHIVVLTDGDPTVGNAVNAATNAITSGIDSVNTVGLPGANTALLQQVATAGSGVFVDGSDLTTLIDSFSNILDGAETLSKLEVFSADGSLLGSPSVGTDGAFSIPLQIIEGENLFRARATSSLGNVTESSLIVNGVAVPEPNTLAICSVLMASTLLRRRRRAALGGKPCV